MQDPDLSDDELIAELRLVRALASYAESAGEADAENIYRSAERAIEFEQRRRAGQ